MLKLLTISHPGPAEFSCWKRQFSSVEMRKSLSGKGLTKVEVDPQGDPSKLKKSLCRQDLATDRC